MEGEPGRSTPPGNLKSLQQSPTARKEDNGRREKRALGEIGRQ